MAPPGLETSSLTVGAENQWRQREWPRPIHGSLHDRCLKIFERQLSRYVATALGAVVRVAPRADQLRTFWIEQDREALGAFVELKSVEGAPLSRNGVAVDLYTLEYPTKAHGLCIEQPGCVARFKNHGIHSSILALKHKANVRFTFTFRDDLRSFGRII